MKDKEIKIRADEEFIQKVDYLQQINGYKNRSDTIRKIIEKEYKKEKSEGNPRTIRINWYGRKGLCEDITVL